MKKFCIFLHCYFGTLAMVAACLLLLDILTGGWRPIKMAAICLLVVLLASYALSFVLAHYLRYREMRKRYTIDFGDFLRFTYHHYATSAYVQINEVLYAVAEALPYSPIRGTLLKVLVRTIEKVRLHEQESYDALNVTDEPTNSSNLQ